MSGFWTVLNRDCNRGWKPGHRPDRIPGQGQVGPLRKIVAHTDWDMKIPDILANDFPDKSAFYNEQVKLKTRTRLG